MPLAVDTYANAGSLADAEGLLNLSWTLDERPCLAADVDALMRRELEAELAAGLEYLNTYFVKDPYGDDLLRPAVGAFFPGGVGAARVTCGAGVNSVLHALAGLTSGAAVHVVGETYPDFPYWVDRHGGRCVEHAGGLGLEEHAGAARDAGAAIVFLERPSLIGDRLADPAEVEVLCAGAERHGALVVIDESNANYYPPAFSAANLAGSLDNLVVVRGFSKAYGLGGLRLGYCVASPAATERIRTAVPPLLGSSLALRIGRAVLELGDVGDPLRERIRDSKAELARLLAGAGLGETVVSSELMPYVLLRNSPGYFRDRVEPLGVRGKLHTLWSGATLRASQLYRMSAPLAEPRRELLRQKLAAPRASSSS
ncbi:MAG: aminotransferase class I/II-fold pyridoxal phosphate-dependent enzyme [Actinomycetota bacterium]|nr:aminotransferase class I/II-fold pyridoxal phosphate-dependent enzyme [Actinomycetota bacterium]